MTLRARIATTAAAAVAVALLVVSVGVYGTTARRLLQQADADLDAAARLVRELGPGGASLDDRLTALEELRGRGPDGRGPEGRPGPDGRGDRFTGAFGVGIAQVVAPDGGTRTVGAVALPVDDETLALAGPGPGEPVRSTVEVDGTSVRVLAVDAGPAGALQLGLPVDDALRALTALRRQLLLVGAVGVGLAALLGAAVADRAVRPVRRLTDAAEDVARTGDLTHRIDVAGEDELGRLATAFNGMLASLEQARAAQRQLVADASHELRTPLTSLRTNVEVLQLADGLEPADRTALLRDVTAQLEEFGRLVDGLVELARGDAPTRAATRVPLRDVVDAVVDRATVFAPDVTVVVDADDSVVVAERDRLERAVANLVDNARKHGGGPVEVTVRAGAVRVRDHGPGIADGDLPHVFDRFYRAPDARSRPGSGLGLSIVAQVAAAHGGTCAAANHPEGGAEVVLALPAV